MRAALLALAMLVVVVMPAGSLTLPWVGTDSMPTVDELNANFEAIEIAVDDLEAGGPGGGGDFMADGSVPMTGDLDLDGNSVLNSGDVEINGFVDQSPTVDTRTTTGSQSAVTFLMKSWFNTDSDKNSSTKTRSVPLKIESVNLRENESKGIWLEMVGGGDTDLMATFSRIFGTGPSIDTGDEGMQGHRVFVTDHEFVAIGTSTGTIAAGTNAAASLTVSGSSLTEDESRQMGQSKLVILGSQTAVTVTNAPPGAFESDGSVDAGWALDGSGSGQGVWTLQTGQVASASIGIGDCFAHVDANYTDFLGGASQHWLYITAVSGETFTTEWIGAGVNMKTPYGYLATDGPADGSPDGYVAACGKIVEPTFSGGEGDFTVDSFTIATGSGFPGVTDPTFEVNAYGSFRGSGISVILSNMLGIGYPWFGFRAVNDISTSGTGRGRIQHRSAFEPHLLGTPSDLENLQNHGFEFGLACDANDCESGILMTYDPDAVGDEQAVMLAFPTGLHNDGTPETWNVMRNLPSYEDSLTYRTDGAGGGRFGQGYSTFSKFMTESDLGSNNYYASTQAEIEAALVLCDDHVGLTNNTGCTINVGGGDITVSNLALAGDGTTALARSGVVLRGVGGGPSSNTDGFPNSGTNFVSGGAAPVITVGSCVGCVIENISIAGNDTATAGIEFLTHTGGSPVVEMVVRNVSMYEINGYGIKGPTDGQFDTSLFQNVSVRDSEGCVFLGDTQSIGHVFDVFDCSQMLNTGDNIAFNFDMGSAVIRDSYCGLTNASQTCIKVANTFNNFSVFGTQFEAPGVASPTFIDGDDGTQGESKRVVVEGNQFIIDSSSTSPVAMDLFARGSVSFQNNNYVATSGTLEPAVTIDVTSGQPMQVRVGNNWKQKSGDGGTRWVPTIDTDAIVEASVLTGSTMPGSCVWWETWRDTDDTAGQQIHSCEGGSFVLQGDGGGGGGAPDTADYLVGTANGSLSAEIVVGTSPGGELGGTWASPTIDSGVVSFGELAAGTAADAQVDGAAESDEIAGLTDGQISDTLTASTSTLAAANTNTTAIATTSFVQQEIDDVDLLSDNCVLENDSTPIPDSCVGDGSDAGGGGGGISYADAAAAYLAGF